MNMNKNNVSAETVVSPRPSLSAMFAVLVVAAALAAFAAPGASAESPATAASEAVALAESAWTETEANAAIAAASRTAPASVELVTGIVRHNLAAANPKKWAAAAVETLAKCAKGGDPTAMAYYGSALTLRAGLSASTGDVAGATADLEQGFGFMDKAVRAAPDSIALRIMRAENAASTSEQSPFKRWDVAAADVAVIEKSGGTLSPENLAGLEVLKARIAFGKGDAEDGIRRLEAAIRTAPTSRAAEAARALLSELED
jgi:hypothetical protein